MMGCAEVCKYIQAGRTAYRSPRTKDVIGQTFYSLTPSTDYINTFRTLSDFYQEVKRLSTSITKMFFNQISYFMNNEIWHKKINFTLNMTLKPPVGGGKSLNEQVIHSTDSFKWLIHSEMAHWILSSLDLFIKCVAQKVIRVLLWVRFVFANWQYCV